MRYARWFVVALVVAAGAVGGFLPYGWVRNEYTEELGLNLKLTVAGLIAASMFCAVFLLPCAIWETRRVRPLSWLPWSFTGTVLAGMLCGCVVAEASILVHEAAFRADVAASPQLPHDRGRAWPFNNSEMHYAPKRGYWSTD